MESHLAEKVTVLMEKYSKSFQFALDKIADAFEKRADYLFSKTQN